MFPWRKDCYWKDEKKHIGDFHYFRWNLRICPHCHEIQRLLKAGGKWQHYWQTEWIQNKVDRELIAQFLKGSGSYGY